MWFEAQIAEEPIIPVHLILEQTVAAACLVNWFMPMVLFMLLFYVPIYFQVKGMSATESGAQLKPHSLGVASRAMVTGFITGFIITKTSEYRIVGLAVMSIFVLASGLFSTLHLESPVWPASIYLFLLGVGHSGMRNVSIIANCSAVAQEYQATITSATYAF